MQPSDRRHEPSALESVLVCELTRERRPGPGLLSRILAHLLIRLLILGTLPAPMQLHALCFPFSLLQPLAAALPQVQVGAASEAATAPDHFIGNGNIISTFRPGRTDYFTFDGLGSATTLTDGYGEAVARYGMDPWGVVKDPAVFGQSPNRVTYTGHYSDTETGLTYAKARYLDNSLGMFVQQDSYLGGIEAPMSLHRLAYAYNNPTRFVDPDGRKIRNPRKMNRGVVTIDDDGNTRMGAVLMEEEITVTADPTKQFDEDVKLGDKTKADAFVASMDAYEEPIKQSMVIMAAPYAVPAVVPLVTALPAVTSTGGFMAISGTLGGAASAGFQGFATAKIYGASTSEAIEQARMQSLPGALAGLAGVAGSSLLGRLAPSASPWLARALAGGGGGAAGDYAAQQTLTSFGLQDHVNYSQVFAMSLLGGALGAASGGAADEGALFRARDALPQPRSWRAQRVTWSDPLARRIIDFRRARVASGEPVSPGRNVAVARYELEGEEGYAFGVSQGRHGERFARAAVPEGAEVKEVGTELQPCGRDYHNCQAYLDREAPGAPVKYVHPYPEYNRAARRASNRLKAREVRRLQGASE